MIGIIDYNMGNVQSVLNAFEYIGAEARVTDKADDLVAYDKIVLPGVGAFGMGMSSLRERGLDVALEEEVIRRKKPFLGICLGMQLVCGESFEFGHHKGLRWIEASVHRIPETAGVRVPHVGWDDIVVNGTNRLIDAGRDLNLYFVHSYYVDIKEKGVVSATCAYGIEFPAMIEKDNIFACQFHPEKSQKIGLGILKRFVGM